MRKLTDDEKALLWLDSFSNFGYVKKKKLVELISPHELFKNLENYEDDVSFIVGKDIFKKMLLLRNENYIDELLQRLNELNTKFITLFSEEYPTNLKNIFDPPLVLYYRGDIQLLKTACLTIVGTRTATIYGRECVEKFVPTFVDNGLTIVTGIADGIDEAAISATLLNEGNVIVVTAGGLDKIYPSINRRLAKSVEVKGLMISEQRNDVQAISFLYNIRNRILAGLSRATLVVEAGEKSGALITANLALDYNREVFSIMGNIDQRNSVGTNNLIINGKATPVNSAKSIVEYYKEECVFIPKVARYNYSEDEEKIMESLKNESKSFDKIMEETQLSLGTLMSKLLVLEASGKVRKLPNNIYKKCKE